MSISLGLSWWLRWQRICLQRERPRFESWSERSPGEGNDYPLQYSCLEKIPWTEEPGGVTELEHSFRKVFLEVELLGHNAPVVVIQAHSAEVVLVYTRCQRVRVPVSTLYQHCLFCLLILKVRNISNWCYFAFQSLSVRLSINWNLFIFFSMNFLFISFSYFFLLFTY